MDRRLSAARKPGPPSWAESELWRAYSVILDLLESGRTDEASVAAADLGASSLQRLIRFRIALKSLASLEIPEGVLSDSEIPWMEAEFHFVAGLADFHLSRFAEGALRFEKAEAIFASLGFESRALLSAYNQLIGQSYSVQIPSASEEVRRLSVLERKAAEAISREPVDLSRCRRVLAMIFRQKAVVFEKEARLHAATHELLQALELFRTEGPQSDYHLVLLHLADLSLDAGDHTSALRYFESVLGPIDARVEFPLSYLRWRLQGESSELELAAFSVVPPTWKERYERRLQVPESPDAWTWNLAEGTLTQPGGASPLNIRSGSLEGKLLRLLAKSPSSRSLLIAALWPEQVSHTALDHRLHQLVCRVNQKLGQLIAFDGSAYRLSAAIRII